MNTLRGSTTGKFLTYERIDARIRAVLMNKTFSLIGTHIELKHVGISTKRAFKLIIAINNQETGH